MLLKTHNVFSAGVLSLAGFYLVKNLRMRPDVIFTAFFISILSNFLIDALGHKDKIEYRIIRGKQVKVVKPVRTYKTHSFLRATVYGFIPAAVLYALFLYLRLNVHIVRRIPYIIFPLSAYFILFQGLLAGSIHLLLDLPTEGGIFVKKNNIWVRYGIAHFKYNNFFLNLAFLLIGAALFLPLFPNIKL